MRFNLMISATAVLLSASNLALAAEPALTKELNLSIYNNNLALVKDIREVNLQTGQNEVAFEGVASEIKPESVLISGQGINVTEYNYNYDLLNTQNIVEKSVGKKVKTVVENPTTGENMFDTATILSANAGTTVLQFSYGIETRFPGRLVFEKLPEGLSQKPTLNASLFSVNSGVQNLMLAYLTNGISWKANYVAKVVDNDNLNLNAWVAINNNSGIDYNDAKVQLIAGDVNQVYNVAVPAFRANNMMLAKAAVSESAADAAAGVPQQISGYQLYTLPNKTDIKNKQTKQVSLFEKQNVKYQKEGRIYSSLYFGGDYQASFEKQHPQMFYIINNEESDNLGIPMPAGVVRFYENDNESNMQFIGENNISHIAKGEKIELDLGNFFDVFVDGKVTSVDKVSEKKLSAVISGCYKNQTVRNYNSEVAFNNSGINPVTIHFVQNINQNTKIIKENIAGSLKNANQYEWLIEVPANGKITLDFVAEVTSQDRICQ